MLKTRKICLIFRKNSHLSIETIKNNRNKFIIFAVNRSAQVLYENGIKPDFVVFSDVVSIKKTINTILDELKETNIIADLRANSYIYKKFNNIKNK